MYMNLPYDNRHRVIQVSAELEKISNYNAKEDTCYEFDVETLLMFRIIACTLSMCGK